MAFGIGQAKGGHRAGGGGGGAWRAALLACALAACDIPLPGVLPTLAEAEENTPFAVVPAARAWLNAPGATVVMQRGLINGSEQRIGLRNATLIQGDNLIVVRTRNDFGQRGRLRFKEFLRRVGGPMFPFEDVESGELMTAEDELGPYFWAERRFGADTICVLALRRLDNGARQLPEDTDAMDILLRNCVDGTAGQALAPVMAASVGGTPVFAPAPGQTRMLSPLAGPTAE